MEDKIYCIGCGDKIEVCQEYYIVDKRYTYCSHDCIEAMENLEKEHEIKKYRRDENGWSV